MNKIIKRSLFMLLLTVAVAGKGSASAIPDPAPQSQVRTLTIQEAVRMALSRSPEMLLAEAQAIRAGEAVRETRSLNRPQVYAGSGLAYNNGMPLSIEGAAPSIFQVRMSQSIFSKKNNNLIREAEEAGKASRLNKESAENNLASQTAMAYFMLHQALKRTALASQRLEVAEAELEKKQSLFEVGKIRQIDITTAETALSAARQQHLVAQEQVNIAEAELRIYTGIPDSDSIQTEEPSIMSSAFDADSDVLYQKALGNAPEIRQAEADIRSKEFHLEAEKGERLPKLDIVGQYALLSDSNNYKEYFNRFERNNYLIGLSIQVPIFDGFRTSSRVAQSRQEIAEARSRLARIKSDLKLATQRATSNLRIARGARDLAVDEMEVTRQIVGAGEAQLQSGRISVLEFEEMKSQLFQKESELLEREQILFQRKLELLSIIGDTSTVLQ
jgi:outer membrane protein